MERLRKKARISHTVWLTTAIAMVIAIAVFSRLDADAYRRAADGAERSRIVTVRAQEVFSLLKDAETGQRGYLLTGDPRYLAPYNQAVLRIEPAMRQLEQANQQAPDDVSRLTTLVNAKLEEVAQTIRVRQQGDVAAALAIVRTDRGRATMEEIRNLVPHIIEHEDRRYRELNDAAQQHGYRTRIVVQLGAVLLAIFLWIATRETNAIIGRLQNAVGDLEISHEREARGRSALATTLRSIGDAVIATDAGGRIQFINPIAEELTGWKSAETEGKPLAEVFHILDENTRQPAADLAARVLRDGKVIGLANHTVLAAKDGREIPVDDSAAPILDDHGKITGVVLVFRDVTQRRVARRQLEESESRYRLLFESNPLPMWVYDTKTLAFLAVNNAAIERYGYTEQEFRSMTLVDIRPPEDVPLLLEEASKVTGAFRTDGARRHRRKDGSLMYVEITAHPIQFGTANAAVAMINDVTERRGLEDQLRQSQKLEAVGQLAGGIAHDFNNLLTVIEGYAEMIRADQPADDPNREAMEEIAIAAQRAASLTRQLLAFSRRQVLQPVRLSLNANVANTQRMLARLLGEPIKVNTNLRQDLWDVWADPGQIDQIILNLSVNARDAMEGGGVLTISTDNVTLDSAAARPFDLPPGEYATLSITDSGTGMDEEIQRHIFEPFFTTKEIGRGTGLGLSTVYGIVKQSGGSIAVKSAPGQGSTFTIALPRAHPAARAPQGAAPSASVHATGATILLLEDDNTVQQLVGAMLKSGGYKVIATTNPNEALHIIGEFTTPIDLLLTDMVLPESNGGAVAEKAAQLRPGLKIMFMSGYTEHPVLQSPSFDSKVPFLQKPFTKAALLAKVREALA